MKLKDDFILTDVAGDDLLIPVGEHSDSFGGIVALNGCSTFLIKQMSDEISIPELVIRLQNEYEVDEVSAKESVEYTVKRLSDLGVIEGCIK